MKAFYFATKERKLRYNDNRQIIVGETHTVEGELELCKNGLHASTRLIDALSYAPGPILYLVDVKDYVIGDDKLAAMERTYFAEFDATTTLQHFARRQALINIELIKPYADQGQYDLIILFLKTGDIKLAAKAARAARAVASTAARVAAWAATRAASAAAWAASATHAAPIAAFVAAEALWAARAVGAARANQNKMLTEMIANETGWDLEEIGK